MNFNLRPPPHLSLSLSLSLSLNRASKLANKNVKLVN